MHFRYNMKTWKDFLSITSDTESKRLLLVCDIDDTILKPETVVGSTYWIKQQCKLLEENKQAAAPSFRQLIKHLNELYQDNPMVPCEASIGNALQRFDTVFLSERNRTLFDVTYRDLKANFDWKFSDCPTVVSSDTLEFKNGLGLTSGNHKGFVLLELLKSLEKDDYDFVIYVDNDLEQLKRVEEILHNRNVMSVLYSGSKKHLKEYDEIDKDI